MPKSLCEEWTQHDEKVLLDEIRGYEQDINCSYIKFDEQVWETIRNKLDFQRTDVAMQVRFRHIREVQQIGATQATQATPSTALATASITSNSNTRNARNARNRTKSPTRRKISDAPETPQHGKNGKHSKNVPSSASSSSSSFQRVAENLRTVYFKMIDRSSIRCEFET